MKKSSILDDKRILVIIAVALAILSWIVIAGFISPGDSKPINQVEINYEQDATRYLNRNLQIVGELTDLYADVQVQGDGSVIGSLGRNDVLVYVDFNRVTGPGTFEVPLRAEKVTAGSYNIMAVSVRNSSHSLEKSPKDTITLTFEEVSSRTLPVQVKADGVTAAEGFFRDSQNIRSDPLEVTISGPKTRVEQIAQVVAEVPYEEALEETKRYTGIELALLDESGGELEEETMGLTFSSQTVTVEVPILETRSINLDVEFIGYDSSFDSEWLREHISLSQDVVSVAGLASAFDHLSDPFILDIFDIKQLELGWESEPINVNTALPDDLRNLDQLQQVIVRMDTVEMSEKTIEVSGDSFRVLNPPTGSVVTPVGDTLSVRLMGDTEQLEALLGENIVIQIDASGVPVGRGGQQTLAVRVQVPGSDRVFAIDDYSIVCDVVTE